MRATYRTALYAPAVDSAAEGIHQAWLATNRCATDVPCDILYEWRALAMDNLEREALNDLLDKIEKE